MAPHMICLTTLSLQLQGGKVTIAATSFLKYFHPRFKSIPPQGHFNLWLEEMKIPPLD